MWMGGVTPAICHGGFCTANMTELSPRLMEPENYLRRTERLKGKGEDKRTPHPLKIGKVSSAFILTNYKPEQPCVSPEPHYHSPSVKIFSHSSSQSCIQGWILTSSTPSLLPFAVEVTYPREVLLPQPSPSPKGIFICVLL